MSTEILPGNRAIDNFLKRQSQNIGSEAEETSQPQEKKVMELKDVLNLESTPEEVEERRQRFTLSEYKAELTNVREELRQARQDLADVRKEFRNTLDHLAQEFEQQIVEQGGTLVERVFKVSFNKLFDARVSEEVAPVIREAMARMRDHILSKIQPHALKQ